MVPPVLGVVVNAATVIIGSILGLIIGGKLTEGLKGMVLTAAGIVTLLVGFQMGAGTSNILLPLLATLLGGLIGHSLGVERTIFGLGQRLHRWVPTGDGAKFATGFLDASVLFCAGAMTIVGSFQSGTLGDHQLLFLKSTLDGFMALILTTTLGPGVLFSALVILIYQGALVLGSGWLEPLLHGRMLDEIGATGGLMVIMIGLNLLELKKIPTADFLPALVLAPILVKVEELLTAIRPGP